MIDILKALADESRLRILSQILKGEMCVCEIEHCLSLTQSNASRHLNILKKAGILDSYKNAQWTYYKISDEFMNNNKELYDYLKIKVSTLPFYLDDCSKLEDCKLQNLCNK
jgi:ArsR family transcriptional regulator